MENGNTEESQNSKQKFNRFSKRNIYMKKKIEEDKNKQNEKQKEEPKEESKQEDKGKSKEKPKEESKEEQKAIQVNKLITQQENKPYNHRSTPKLKVKNKTPEENNDINHNEKESKRYKSPITISNKEIVKEQKSLPKSTNLEIKKADKTINVHIDDSANDNKKEINNNENKITVNLKKDIDKNNDNTNNDIKPKENINEKSKDIKNIDNESNINKDQKLNPNLDVKKTNNINIISSDTKESEKVLENKNNKARTKLDITKDPSKSLLAGGPKKECPQCHSLIESHLYKIHVKNVHLSQILSWLYLGSFANACDLDELKRNNIKYILNCAVECKNENLPSDIKELHLKLVDEPEFDITKYFKQTNDFINKVRTAGGNLLVHCKVGLSRSPTVIIAYLIKYYEFTADSAMNFIKRKRPQIIPNQGFIKQLYEYEKKFEKKFKKNAKK